MLILDCRYVSSIEAMDRIYGFPRFTMSHTVYRMYFHLPNEQSVVFREDNIEHVLDRAGEKDTMLTAWFKLNREDNYAKSLLYCEIPYSYVFNELAREWRPRQRGSVYTRLHHIHPRNRELFNLRLLLLNVRGPESFEDLRTVNGTLYSSFTEAAIALNLIDNDRQWNECIEEALSTETPYRVRFLFANICMHCHPNNPSALTLWNSYQERMSDDFVTFNGDTIDIAVQKSLQHIYSIFRQNGRIHSEFDLPELNPNVPDYRIRNNDIVMDQEMSLEEHNQKAQTMRSTFNEEQKVLISLNSLTNYIA